MNVLGYPNMSAFGTFAYCASAHLDNDDSATSGWVMRRPDSVSSVFFSSISNLFTMEQIPRNESNFVYASHSLLLEMAQNMFWFWRAQEDEHGTTMNSLALKHPRSFAKYAHHAGDRGQWTRAEVLPHSVVQSATTSHVT
jgi:hypothetical protein